MPTRVATEGTLVFTVLPSSSARGYGANVALPNERASWFAVLAAAANTHSVECLLSPFRFRWRTFQNE